MKSRCADNPYLRPTLAAKMAEHTFKKMVEFLIKCLCVDITDECKEDRNIPRRKLIDDVFIGWDGKGFSYRPPKWSEWTEKALEVYWKK